MERLEALHAWSAQALADPGVRLDVASADASFRRYFRVTSGARTFIAMDAPPEHEDCRPFVHVARLFRAAGANVPEVLAEDLPRGFLLLTDFGTRTFLDVLDPDRADALYQAAITALVAIQRASRPGELPPYDRAVLEREIGLFPQWYLGRHLSAQLSAQESAELERVFEAVVTCNLAEPRAWVHRDYHSRNLMLTEPCPGILDFQDALFGPISYDLVSLLRDAYVDWPEARELDWVIRYWEHARAAGLPVRPDFADFYRDYEWMGVQRQLKVLGIFARLWHRDGKDRYLADLPRVRGYLRRTAGRYRELAPLARLIDRLEGVADRAGLTF